MNRRRFVTTLGTGLGLVFLPRLPRWRADDVRSEEHTSELQSRFDLVCRLLLEKKNDRGSGHIDILTDDEMIGRDLRADRNQAVVADAEFGDLALGLDLGDHETPALGLAHVLHL